MLIDEIIAGNARRTPHAVGWTFDHRPWTWDEIDRRISAQADGLRALGLEPGDRVALFSENSHVLAELYFALPRAGLVAVPVNPRSVKNEIDFLLTDVGARAFIVAPEFVPRLGDLKSLPLTVDFLIGTGREAKLHYDLEELMTAQRSGCAVSEHCSFPMRAIKYTSGTTGSPKGCISSQNQFLFNLQHYLINMPMDSEDRCLLALPMAAGVGIYLLSSYAYAGAQTFICERFKAAEFLDAIEHHRITRFYAVPTMLNALVAEQKRAPRDLRSLRFVGYGGQAAARVTILQAMETLGCDLYQTFGASEAGGFITYLGPADHRAIRDGRPTAADTLGRAIMPCGREVQGFHVRIVDADFADVGPNEVGEIVIHSDSTMTGYWNRPEQTAEVLAGDWLRTGDMGRKDDDGMIYVVDRKRDMIITGGLNVYSLEVENVLYQHDDVLEAAVVGVADDCWGERVEAFVVLKRGSEDAVHDLQKLCDRMLASYKRPKGYTVLAELPKTSSGKIRKIELRNWNGPVVIPSS